MDLFDSAPAKNNFPSRPLAEAMRPTSLDEFVGQEHLLGAGKLLGGLSGAGKLRSLILWGPPGSGKTTLAQILANSAGAHCVHFSAVTSGVKDLKKIIQDAEQLQRSANRQCYLSTRSITSINPSKTIFSPMLSGHTNLDRRHHRESLVRSDLSAAVALSGASAQSAFVRRHGRILDRALSDTSAVLAK